MTTSMGRTAVSLSAALGSATGAVALVVLLAFGSVGPAAAKDPADYKTPEAAAQAILDALAKADHAAILGVLGDKYKDELFTGEESREKDSYQRVVAAAKDAMQLRADDADTRVMVIGKDAWPVPFPIVHGAKGWHFDTAAGIDEILARRIGQDELATIATLRAYVDAQTQYAGVDRDGDQVLEYAQKVISTPGKKDGLYWQVASADDAISPLGPFVAELPDYVKERKPGEPYMGYYYRILTRQGENAPGGRYDYVINGNMIAGFGAVAVPAEYGATGVMTFVVSHQGKVYQKDLGEDTPVAAAAIQEYNPDETWTLVKE
ncbi:MAG TPA: DUF2950 domain-containing protein [Candidatus Acidoferrum sp.]|nr:DUF2950 domain-containing protein [Candidatus Acidoferrum sp.]